MRLWWSGVGWFSRYGANCTCAFVRLRIWSICRFVYLVSDAACMILELTSIMDVFLPTK